MVNLTLGGSGCPCTYWWDTKWKTQEEKMRSIHVGCEIHELSPLVWKCWKGLCHLQVGEAAQHHSFVNSHKESKENTCSYCTASNRRYIHQHYRCDFRERNLATSRKGLWPVSDGGKAFASDLTELRKDSKPHPHYSSRPLHYQMQQFSLKGYWPWWQKNIDIFLAKLHLC